MNRIVLRALYLFTTTTTTILTFMNHPRSFGFPLNVRVNPFPTDVKDEIENPLPPPPYIIPTHTPKT